MAKVTHNVRGATTDVMLDNKYVGAVVIAADGQLVTVHKDSNVVSKTFASNQMHFALYYVEKGC